MEVQEVSTPSRLTIVKRYGSPSSGAYGLGWLGAFIYYLHSATTFTAVVVGFVKALVWPAILVYYLFSFLKL